MANIKIYIKTNPSNRQELFRKKLPQRKLPNFIPPAESEDLKRMKESVERLAIYAKFFS